DRLAHERQRTGPPADGSERFGQMNGLHIDHAVAEALVGAGATVVDLVRIEQDDLPAPADPRRPAAVEDPDDAVGHPDRVGVMAGMGLMMFLVPLGLGSVVLQIPLVLKALHWGGAAVLLWLSWKIATSRRIESTPGGNPVGFVGAAVFQWINPKSWLVSASAAGTFLSAEGGSPIMQ